MELQEIKKEFVGDLLSETVFKDEKLSKKQRAALMYEICYNSLLSVQNNAVKKRILEAKGDDSNKDKLVSDFVKVVILKAEDMMEVRGL